MGADEAFPRDYYRAYLARMQSHAVTVAMRSLGQQLTIAAGLCRAYIEGALQTAAQYSIDYDLPGVPAKYRRAWNPGCERDCPPWFDPAVAIARMETAGNDHDFVGGECDCQLCGEGWCHYLHDAQRKREEAAL
ncbi:MAG TPA: hypothetical protein VG994_02575 [Steroidobacteraceae bacterium]|nr:hypothetical protein [Steroidobacteraceae bacterium]